MSTVMITGATGMVGSTMIDYILSEHPDFEVVALRRRRSDLKNVKHLQNNPKVRWEIGDLSDTHSLYAMVRKYKPDRCFHMAAMSHVPTSWLAPAECMQTNAVGQINLFEAIREVCPDCRIQVCGSSEEYGLVAPDEIPIAEDNPLRPLSPYACSKVAQDSLGFQYARSYGMKIVRTRAFNHSGARRHEGFAEASFSLQIAQIEKGMRKPVIHHGNLESIRDMTNVKDIVEAYWISLDGKCEWGEVYNICSGNDPRIQAILDHLLSLSDCEITTKIEEDRMRPSDVPVLIGDASKFREATGWAPTYTWQETVAECLDYWRTQV
ncbi:MAG: GDP-mannose 4,6-dehydratase [Candidatus Latescibacteria bacterium]|jgi:GDP-4-dehydro-6-deoxy-D-mannose reductase|nr:GDP-mannose 4,6-dehydratase [Candidatus Latescibacterota bacterium]